jgi:phage terminase small subunit
VADDHQVESSVKPLQDAVPLFLGVSDVGSIMQRHKVFVQAYINNLFNATQAAVSAGYSPNTANVQGARLLHNAHVQQLLKEVGVECPKEEISADAETVKAHLIRSITHGLKTKLNERGQVEADWLSMSADDMACIKHITYGKNGEPIIHFHDRDKAAELLGRHFGMFVDRRELTGKDGQPLIPPTVTVNFVPKKKEDENV